MTKLTLFTNKNCPHCPPVIERMKEEGLDFRIVDTANSISELKEFLRYRDTDSYFDAIKAVDAVGVPTLMDEDGNFYDPTKLDSFADFK